MEDVVAVHHDPLDDSAAVRGSHSCLTPCLSQNALASSSWSGVLSANVSTPFMALLAIPVRVPAGGSSRRPVTPRSSIVSMHRSQRTGVLTCVTIRCSTSWPSRTTLPSRLEMTGMRGSWVDTDFASPASTSTAGAMWSVWKAPATDSGTSRALAGGASANAWGCSTGAPPPTRRGRVDGARRDDLPGTVVVRGGQSVLGDLRQHLVPVAAEDGGHAGGCGGGGGGHRPATLPDQDHGLFGGDPPCARGRGQLADAVTGHRADPIERVGRVREQLDRGEQAGGDQ